MRLAVAGQRAVTEDQATAVYERRTAHFHPSHQAALGLADALMSQPSSLSDDAIVELRRHFTDQQLIEHTVDVMKWNFQKVMVALDIDPEISPGELVDLVFDEHGHWVR